MKRNHEIAVKMALAVIGALFVGLFLVPRASIIRAQERREQRIGLPTDWSHHHMIYSTPHSPIEALSLEREPRYLQQWYRRNPNRNPRGGRGNGGEPDQNISNMGRDWSLNMGGSSTGTVSASLGADNYPSKYSFNVNSADCTNDYVAFNTSVAGAAPATANNGSVQIIHTPTTGDTITLTAGPNTSQYRLVTSLAGGNNIANNILIVNMEHGETAENIFAAINGNASQCSNAPGACFGTGTVANPNFTTTGCTTCTLDNNGVVGLSAHSNFTVTTSDATDITVASGTNGSNAQASIIAYNNLYKTGCTTGTVPSVMWSYDTKNASAPALSGIISTSTVISGDGSQIAFIDTPASGAASLVILKWKAGEGASYDTAGTAAATPGGISSTGSAYVTCKQGSGSCMAGLAFANSINDVNSSPFYDYINDVLYVGDSTGHIHKFSGVFNGTPAEVGNPWITLSNASGTDVTTGPVYDSVSGRVFIGDHAGFLYNIACTSGVNPVPCSQSGVTTTQHASAAISTGGNGVFETPIVDGTAAEVYAFVSHNTGTTGGAGTNRSAVFQFATTFGSGAFATSTTSISNSTTEPTSIFAGDFDNAYYTSDLGSTGANRPTGNLYVCGVVTGVPTLYQIPITTDTMGTAVALQPMASAATPCGPITEAFNQNGTGGAEDWIFMSVQGSSSQNGSYGCTSAGCVMSLAVTQWQASTPYLAGQYVIDSNHDLELVTTAGTSKTGMHPSWGGLAATTADGSVAWLNQGPAVTLASWAAGSTIALDSIILDQNGFIQEVTSTGATPHHSGGTLPAWGTETRGSTTTDGNLTWTNLGPAGISTLAAAGGSSGFIIDNFVNTTTLAGGSQIYYTPLTATPQTCGTGGLGGCAVQASQAGLN